MNDKKIGLAIVTYGSNYGTYLQAFATQFFIRKIGRETEVINIDSVAREVGAARKRYFLSRIFSYAEMKSYFHVFWGIAKAKIDAKYRKNVAARQKYFDDFREKEFCFSERRDSWNGLTELCKERYGAVVVGSDQLWRPANIAGNFYTLNFVPDETNKIAFATSFGLKEIRANQRDAAIKFLSRIDHLSVREAGGAKIVKELTGRNIPVVCDPTLMLTKDEWSSFCADEPRVREKYVVCYFLGDNKKHREFAKRLARATGCRLIGITHVAGYVAADKNVYDEEPTDVGPFEFLNLIKNAEYVCTDSFHGCVFTIQFERKLFAFRRFANTNKMSTNGRITTLLQTLGMEERLVWGTESVDDYVKKEIDYEAVGAKLQQKRSESAEYLEKAFADEKTDL